MMDIVDRLRSPEVFIMDGPMISPVAFDAAEEIERLRDVLQSISNNTCCDNCQEAALVARDALKEKA